MGHSQSSQSLPVPVLIRKGWKWKDLYWNRKIWKNTKPHGNFSWLASVQLTWFLMSPPPAPSQAQCDGIWTHQLLQKPSALHAGPSAGLCLSCVPGEMFLHRYILTLWNSDFLKNVTDPYIYAGLNQSDLCYDKGWSHSLSLLSVKRCWRKSKCFPNSCLILLNPSFMPKLDVMEKLTCLQQEVYWRVPSLWPSGVSNQFSHHEWESKSQKRGGNDYEVSYLSFNAVSWGNCVSLQYFSLPPPMFSCYFFLLQLIALSFQPFPLLLMPVFF